jgi:hypothetical protein
MLDPAKDAGLQADTAGRSNAGLFPRMARVLDLFADDAATGLCFIANQIYCELLQAACADLNRQTKELLHGDR